MEQEGFWSYVWPAFDGMIGQGVLVLLLLMFGFTDVITIDRVLRYKTRAGSMQAVRASLNAGLNYLIAVATTAPLVGVFGTTYHILTGFKGCGCSMESMRAALAYEYSRALVPLALSSIVAAPAMWASRYLRSAIDLLDLEMEIVRLDSLNYLARNKRSR